MVSLASIKLDSSGMWKDDPWGIGFQFCIASGTTPEFIAAIREALRVREQDEAAYQRKYSEALARYILTGWKGLEGEDGAPLPYSYAQALKFMTEPDSVHLRGWVDSVASITAEYLVATRAKAGKA